MAARTADPGRALDNIRALLPEITGSVDIIIVAADDWGTARLTPSRHHGRLSLIFLPYHQQRINAAVQKSRRMSSASFTLLRRHHDLIDLVITDSGFDVLNPVNDSAGGHSHREWKDKARTHCAMGREVNAQVTLPVVQ